MSTDDRETAPDSAGQPLTAEQIEAIRQSLPECLRNAEPTPVPTEPRYPPGGPFVPPPRSPRPPGGRKWRYWRARARGRTPEQMAQIDVLPMLNATTRQQDDRAKREDSK